MRLRIPGQARMSTRWNWIGKEQDDLDPRPRRSKRSKSFLAAEAIAAYVDSEAWQLEEIEAGIEDLERRQVVSHEKVSKWLRSWGKTKEAKAPR